MKGLIKLLESMVIILDEEREILINNDGDKLVDVVKKKNNFIKELEEYKGIDLSENKEVVSLIEEINSLQETNLVLTNQAINYNNLFLDALNDMTDDRTSGYSKDGKIAKSKKNIIDQSV